MTGRVITTPDRRLRVFVSSTLTELAEERRAARAAIEQMQFIPVMFEIGARDHPPQEVYRSYEEQSDVFVGIYWESGGETPPGQSLTGLEEEFAGWTKGPRLLYVKEPAPRRSPRLAGFLDDIRAKAEFSYRAFSTPAELAKLINQDLAVLISERFLAGGTVFPTGTVTFLFTDIEGSTRILQTLGDRYSFVLDEHNRLIREGISIGEGVEVDTAGDGFFAVFSSAVGAIRAATEAQRLIGQHPWPDGVKVRVRMGLHTGEGILASGHYVGIDVHRAARIGAAGHGGQILVSASTAALVDTNTRVSLIDLGRHRLKDLPADEHIYQVSGQGLETKFPPLRSLDGARTNLLDKTSTFVGREAEIRDVVQLLESNRLVTLSGPGGTGKTRLAIQVGRQVIDRFAGGVWLIQLAPLRSANGVAQACADAVGLHEQPGRSLEETLFEYLRSVSALILFDNCEHLLGAIGALARRVLERCPEVSVVATSREPLRVPGELVFPVPPLALPTDSASTPDSLIHFDSVRLFVERASLVNPRFKLDDLNVADVARLVKQLDGLPLAVELAAARMGSLSSGQIADRIEDSFELLRDRGTTGEPRHRTMSNVVDWSYSLLTNDEQVVFRRMSVFRGGFDLEAAEFVTAEDPIGADDVADLVSALVDRSLVVAEGGTGGFRYRLLESIRQFGASQLTSAGEDPQVRDRHAQWYCRRVGPALWPFNPQPSWYSARMADHHNIETAHDHLLATGKAAAALEMATALGWFWYNEGYWTEGRARLALCLNLSASEAALAPQRSQANVVAALLSFRQGDYEEALALCEEAERLAGVDHPTLLASARTARALALVAAERWADATTLIETVLASARASEGPWFVAAVLIVVGRAALSRGDLAPAASAFEEASSLFVSTDDPWGLASAWEGLGLVKMYQRSFVAAERALLKSLAANPIADDKASLPTALLGACRLGRGEDEATLGLIEEGAATIFRRRDWVARSILIAAVVPTLVKNGYVDRARSLVERDLEIARTTSDSRGRCRSLAAAGRFYARLGDRRVASTLAAEQLALRTALGEARQIAGALLVVAEAVLAGGIGPVAARLKGAADALLALQTPGPWPNEIFQSDELGRRLSDVLDQENLDRELIAGQALDAEAAVTLAEESLRTLSGLPEIAP